jgi:large subunit ribosomal protein L13
MKLKSTIVKEKEIKRSWHLIDLAGKTLGRISVEIARLLMGKDKPSFSFNRDDGDYVVAINARKIVTTGNKLKNKIYYHHSAFTGHLSEMSLKNLLEKDARLVISHGVAGMLPKNTFRSRRLARLKIFNDSDHTYADKIK